MGQLSLFCFGCFPVIYKGLKWFPWQKHPILNCLVSALAAPNCSGVSVCTSRGTKRGWMRILQCVLSSATIGPSFCVCRNSGEGRWVRLVFFTLSCWSSLRNCCVFACHTCMSGLSREAFWQLRCRVCVVCMDRCPHLLLSVTNILAGKCLESASSDHRDTCVTSTIQLAPFRLNMPEICRTSHKIIAKIIRGEGT